MSASGWDVTLERPFPTPRRESTIKLTYEVPGYQARDSSGYIIIVRVIITLETGGDDPYMDYDCYGYKATQKGVRDKRSGFERKYISRIDHAWINDYIEDALLIEGWRENADGTYTIMEG